MKQIVECVPNFSDGNNQQIIAQIADAIDKIARVNLLDVDSGKAANRTVMTFAGNPEAVIEAAFQSIKLAGELIDMRYQKGEHLRFGACDVCPLIPISGISMAEVVNYAHQLSKRIGDELGIPVYNYEYAAFSKERKNLARCRAGEYEGLKVKMQRPGWKPDFGPDVFNEKVARTGAVAIGARKILVAYNVNLESKSAELASIIAAEVREKGSAIRQGDQLNGELLRDSNGKVMYEPGLLRYVKGIGWYMNDFGFAQCSYNLTNIEETAVHKVFEATCERAEAHGLRVRGSELVGLIPISAMLDAGKYFLEKQGLDSNRTEKDLVQCAIKNLGLNDAKPFDPNRKIIEYAMRNKD